MVNDFGWNIVAAYGNADTDITAYANVNIPLAADVHRWVPRAGRWAAPSRSRTWTSRQHIAIVRRPHSPPIIEVAGGEIEVVAVAANVAVVP